MVITNRNTWECRQLVCNGKWSCREPQMGNIVLQVVELEEVSGWVSQILLQAQELDHTHQIAWTYFKGRMTAMLHMTAWSAFTDHAKVLLVWQRVSYLYRRCTKWDGRHRDRKIQSIDCIDNLTHHMLHWLSSCYQSVCISPTLHGLPVLVNMPHTRYPTAWKRVQRSIKNFLIP